MKYAVDDPSDEVAEMLGWHQEMVSDGDDFDGRERHSAMWCSSDGKPVIGVWDFRKWPQLAEEIRKAIKWTAAHQA